MSVESAAAFYERLQSDASLLDTLNECGGKERLMQYVKDELGYDFTPREMRKVLFERNPEMTEEELQSVVGGTSPGMGGEGMSNGVTPMVIVAMGL